MFGLGVEPKEIFLAYSIQFVFLTIRLVPGNVVMVTTDMRGKSPITGGVNIWNNVKTCVFQYFRSFYCRCYFCFKISVSYCLYFCLDGYFDGCVVPITAAAVVFIYLCVNLFVFLFFCFYLFIYLCIYLFIYLVIYYLFCHFDCYSYFCCHRYCSFCCWSHRCFLCAFGYCSCQFNANVFSLGFIICAIFYCKQCR